MSASSSRRWVTGGCAEGLPEHPIAPSHSKSGAIRGHRLRARARRFGSPPFVVLIVRAYTLTLARQGSIETARTSIADDLRGGAMRCIYTHMLDHVRAASRIARECTCMRVRQASRVLTKIYDTELRSTGLQESQLSVLVAIAHFGESGATIGNLAQALRMDRTTVTRN